MILLRIGTRPTTEELGHRGDTGLEVVLNRPEREVAANIRIYGCEHRGPLAPLRRPLVFLVVLFNAFAHHLPIRIDPPFPSRAFDSSDPLLGLRLVARTAQLPRVTFHPGIAGVLGFDVEPGMVDGDVVAVNCGEKLAYLRRDGLAGYACWLRSCTCCTLARCRRGSPWGRRKGLHGNM